MTYEFDDNKNKIGIPDCLNFKMNEAIELNGSGSNIQYQFELHETKYFKYTDTGKSGGINTRLRLWDGATAQMLFLLVNMPPLWHPNRDTNSGSGFRMGIENHCFMYQIPKTYFTGSSILTLSLGNLCDSFGDDFDSDYDSNFMISITRII